MIPALASRTGGPAAIVVESSLALRRFGIEPTVFTTDMAEAASAASGKRVGASDLPAGADALDLRLFPAHWPYRLAFSPALAAALRRELRRWDLLHVISLYLFPQFAAFREARRQRMPYVVSPQGALDPYLRGHGRARKALTETLWQRRGLERAATMHVTSEDEARLVSDVAPAVRRRIVPNGIRWRDFQELPPREDFRRGRLSGFDGPLVLFLGRITYKKGIDVLIRAMGHVVREVPEARLVVAGPDDEGLTARLEALCEAEGMAGSVVFVGMLAGEERLAALASADVWALSSHTENFGIAVAEAMAAGLATVISPAVNIAPDVAAAGAGLVSELRPDAFGEALTGLLVDTRRREEFGARAREFARRYDWDAVAPQLADMYREAAGAG